MIDKIKDVRTQDVIKSLSKSNRDIGDLLNLISPAANDFIEDMAKIAKSLTVHHHGKMVNMFLPLYISDYCENECIYCGFRAGNQLQRVKLESEDIVSNYEEIHKTGIDNILLLTGESHKYSPPEYIALAVKYATSYFSSVTVEVYPMEINEYKLLVENGADGVTVYQETYDRDLYDKVHLKGRKKNYDFRYEAPERAIKAGFKQITIGALYGLGDPYYEAYATAKHLMELKMKYPHIEYSVSFPRIRSAENMQFTPLILKDSEFVKIMLAFRLVFPEVGMVLSTRESKQFRDGLTGICITKLSAGSKTNVGGYSQTSENVGQFEITDKRGLEEITSMIKSKNMEPVFKNWVNPSIGVQNA